MIIDCHVHAQTEQKIKKLLLSMKKNKIDKSIVVYWPNIGGTKESVFEFSSLKELVSNIKNHPELLLVGSLRVTERKTFRKQFEEIKKYISKRQIAGVKLYLGYEHLFANDPRCDKIYEFCGKHHVPVVFHTGDTWKFKKAVVRFANPIYIDDVASKFPKLKILISHLGNPCWIKETAEVIYKNENVFADFSGTLSFPGRFERQYNGNLRKKILELVIYCGTPRKLLFGSDFDVYKQHQYISFLNTFKEFSEEDLEYIKYKNAQNLFGA